MAAPSGVTIRVVFNNLAAASAGIHAGAVAEVERAAREIEADAKAHVAVLTGTLRRSITTQIGAGGLTATVGPSVEYGKWIEWGSRGRGPRPYMRPAAAVVYPRFVERMKALTRKGGLG